MKKNIILLAILNLTVGCSTIFNGGSQSMIASNPDGMKELL